MTAVVQSSCRSFTKVHAVSELKIRDWRSALSRRQIRAGRGVRFPSVTSESEFFVV
jgi:hypothetical protein